MTSLPEITIESAQQTCTLSLEPQLADLRVTDLLRQSGFPLNTRCGQKGLCNGCFVELLSGCLKHALSGATLDASQADGPIRACQYRLLVDRALRLRVPARSLLASKPQIVTSFQSNVSRAHDPLYQPNGEAAFGLAVDLGTTTVAALLVDLSNGAVVGTASALNAQNRLGDNVLTRINLCLTKEDALDRLQAAVIRGTLRPLVEELLGEAGLSSPQLRCATIAGNTTMLHLFAGVDPSSMGTAPFTPSFIDYQRLPAQELACHLFPVVKQESESESQPAVVEEDASHDLIYHLLPGGGAYVGADVVSGVLSSGMAYAPETSLLVDVGTNGEIVLMHQDHLLACATAAGPAFEGAGLGCGMRATHGAISHVNLPGLRDDPVLEVIGDVTPIGMCGTAYVDFVAEARRHELLGVTGRFGPAAVDHPCIAKGEYGNSFTLAHDADGEPVVVSEADIASLLQAKAAIAAGIVCLLKRVGLQAQDVQRLYLAGGFGFHMNIDSVLRCGLLPGFTSEQIQLVGNTSLAGAFLSLVDRTALDEIQQLARRMEMVELNLEPDFEMVYIDHLGL